MLRNRLLYKLSHWSLAAHQYFAALAKYKPNAFEPYKLEYVPNPANPKIIHIIGNFIVGGSTQLVVDIIERTSDKFFHRVVVPGLPDQVKYEPLDVDEYWIDQMSEFRDFLLSENPALVHIHYFTVGPNRCAQDDLWYDAVFRVCADLGITVIQNVNVPTSPHPSPCVVHNVFVSEHVRKEFNNSSVESSVIHPGSDFRHFNPKESVDRAHDTVGMVYRLDSDKLSPESIEPFIEAVRLKPNIRCHIVGGGSLYAHFRHRVHVERMDERFVFTGFVSYESLPSHYSKFGVFVAPVYQESFGQVTPFAMGMGLAVAGYDTGALPEILGSRDTLVPTGDAKGLGRMLVDLSTDPDRIESLGRANKARALEHFSVENMIEKYRSLYSRLT